MLVTHAENAEIVAFGGGGGVMKDLCQRQSLKLLLMVKGQEGGGNLPQEKYK
jgi:hypothetical protein